MSATGRILTTQYVRACLPWQLQQASMKASMCRCKLDLLTFGVVSLYRRTLSRYMRDASATDW